jgi:hypothetical protein
VALVADAISGAAAVFNPDGVHLVVVDLGTYEFDPPGWLVAIGEAILRGEMGDDGEGTTACPHTHTTDDNEVALCAN